MTNGSGQSVAPATLNTYDASGRVIRTDKYNSVTLTETTAGTGDYTALGTPAAQCKLVVASTGAVLNSTLTFYDALGNKQCTVSPRGLVTQNQYDANNRLTNTLVFPSYCYWNDTALGGTNTPNPTGAAQTTGYAYDANGNQTMVTDAAGHATISVYDSSDREIETLTPAAAGGGMLARYTFYDGLGRKIQQTDAAGVSTGYSYDYRGLLTSVTLAAGTGQPATTVYAYDEPGNEVAQTDAAGRITTFQYDALGHRIGRTLPGGQSESFGYDLSGNQIYQTNFNGVIITNLYDSGNRLTNQASINGYRVSFGYSPTGWRTNMVDASGQTAYFYDAMGQLTNKVVAWTNGPVRSLNYGYDPYGALTNLSSGTYGGVSNACAYDLLGRLTNVLANGSAAAGYGFDRLGNLQSLRYGNGVTNLCQYDALNRLTNQVWNLQGTTLASFVYTLGPTGNRTALIETNNGTVRSYAWAYDSLYRLTQETLAGGTSGTLNYSYDLVGNRTNRTSSLSVLTNQSLAYTANDWLTNDAYDSNGNTTNSSGNSYQYDALNHATNVNNGGILLAYDGDGNRTRKTVSGTTTYYLLDDRNPSGYVQVLEEWSASGGTTNLNRVYNYGLNLVSQRAPGSSTNYFVFDGHGSTRALTDNAGNVANIFAYDAYGTLIASNTTPQTAYLYCGQQFDSDLGFYYNRARYVSQNTGRFWSMDTYKGDDAIPLSLHKYIYCRENPVENSDPLGLDVYRMAEGWIHQYIVGDDGEVGGAYTIQLNGADWDGAGPNYSAILSPLFQAIGGGYATGAMIGAAKIPFLGWTLQSFEGPAPIEYTWSRDVSAAQLVADSGAGNVVAQLHTDQPVDAILAAEAAKDSGRIEMYVVPSNTCRTFAARWMKRAAQLQSGN